MPIITEVAASLPAAISPAQMTTPRSNLPPPPAISPAQMTTIAARLLYLSSEAAVTSVSLYI
jgi:hypothetical protein